MSSLVEILLEEGSHKVHLLVTTLTTTKMVLSSIQALSNPSEYTLVLEGSGEQDIVLVDDVPVLSCKRRPGDRLLVRRRPGPDGMTRQLLAVSLGLQETAARQFRVIENIRLVAVMHPT